MRLLFIFTPPPPRSLFAGLYTCLRYIFCTHTLRLLLWCYVHEKRRIFAVCVCRINSKFAEKRYIQDFRVRFCPTFVYLDVPSIECIRSSSRGLRDILRFRGARGMRGYSKVVYTIYYIYSSSAARSGNKLLRINQAGRKPLKKTNEQRPYPHWCRIEKSEIHIIHVIFRWKPKPVDTL